VGRVIQTLAEGELVRGVTSLDDRLYVLRGDTSSEQIEVYDVDSYCFLRCITVQGLGTTSDIVACEHNRCAYISDSARQAVRRVALADGAPITHWPVNDIPYCLSITVKYSVLVTCRKVGKVKEFTTKGHLLREIVLPQDIFSPWQTVQLSSGELIVCHGYPADKLHRVCMIGLDSNVQVVKSFGGHTGSGSQLMNSPSHIAVDGNGYVFVVDLNNYRVLLLSPTLTYVREVVSFKPLEWKLYRLSLDVKRRLLYVAQYRDKMTEGRVSVITV